MPHGVLVRCRYCRSPGKEPNHQHGFIVRSSNSSAILVGATCAQHHFPDKWGLIQGRWTKARRRANAHERCRDLITAWPGLKAEIVAFNTCPAWGIHDTLSKNLQERLPRFYEFILKLLSQSDGELKIIERVRDIAAEEKLPENAPARQIFKDQLRSLGSLSGREFLTGAGALRASFVDIYGTLSEEIGHLQKVGLDIDTDDLNARLRKIAGLFKQIKAALRRVRSVREFAEPDHLRRLCLCATFWRQRIASKESYSFDGRNIVGVENGASPFKCPVQAVEMPATPRLDAYII